MQGGNKKNYGAEVSSKADIFKTVAASSLILVHKSFFAILIADSMAHEKPKASAPP